MLKSYLIALVLTPLLCISLNAENEAGHSKMTQSQFSIQLVQSLHLQGSLPLAPSKNDYIVTLESLGISPLDGWKASQSLKEEDYIVIMAKLLGKEKDIYTLGQEFCNKQVDQINQAWEKQNNTDGKRAKLRDLLKDPRYFPQGELKCPFGSAYTSLAGKNKIKRHVHLQKDLVSLRWGFQKGIR